MKRNLIRTIRQKYADRYDPYSVGIKMLIYGMADNLGVILPPMNPTLPNPALAMPPFIPSNTATPLSPEMLVYEQRTKTQWQMMFGYGLAHSGRNDMRMMSTMMRLRGYNMVIVGHITSDMTEADGWQWVLEATAEFAMKDRPEGKPRRFWPHIKRLLVFNTGMLLEWELLNPDSGETIPISDETLRRIQRKINSYDSWGWSVRLMLMALVADG
jgi:hypothetical protein